MISVIILTKDEEQNLPNCLLSLTWTDDVLVLDSGSTDDTTKIALAHGARISTNEFKSFGMQRNFALENLYFKYDWILFLDADEVVTPKFVNALKKAIFEAGDDTAGYYCCWKMILENRWLKYCDNFPKWQFRLVKKGRASFKDFGHGQKEGEVLGKISYIREPYLHYSFSKGWTEWIERQNKYSSLEAQDRLYKKPPFRDIFSKDSSIRNPALKSRLSGIPGWPAVRFFHSYFVNFGFLDGTPGLIYCINMAYHEFLIQIKMRELKMIRKKEKIKSKEKIYLKALDYNKKTMT